MDTKRFRLRRPAPFRSELLTAHEAGATKAELARALGVSRQRVDEVLGRARHERAAGVGDVTD
jgi:DNA-directed RNA polymerase specialized sigma24 family protein